MRVPAGKHTVRIDARGVVRTAQVDVAKGGWAVVSLMGLRVSGRARGSLALW